MRRKQLVHVLKYFALLPLALLVSGCQGIALLDPKGPIAAQQTNLMLMAVGLGLLVIIPVFFMVGWFSLRYRESNKKATYKPHWEGNIKVEAVIWLVPIAIIVVLSYLTWVKTIDLDPYKPIASTEKAIRVQVVSLDWNWLFIYPDENVATLNELTIPAGVPVTFDLTSATVMTSFFIPDLGSQIYAMAGMTTHLNLLSDRPGVYTGYNMGFSGKGYARMNFPTKAVPKEQYAEWLKTAKAGTTTLTLDQFNQLNKPQAGLPAVTYSSVEPDLFGHIVGEFMKQKDHAAPMAEGHSDQSHSSTN